MEQKQYVQKLLEMSKSFDVTEYQTEQLRETHRAYEGTPKKHPHDETVLVLLTNPFLKQEAFYEFPMNSISIVEDLGTITSETGQTAYKIRVWIKKGMPALRSEPFIVD